MNAHVRPAHLIPATEGRTYAGWWTEGEAWVRQWCAANMRRPVRPYEITHMTHDWMTINAPRAVVREHFVATKAARDAEFGAAGFQVGQYGLERVS